MTKIKRAANTQKKKTSKKPSEQTEQTADSDSQQLKKLEDFERTNPLQLELFGFIQPSEKRYSNTIELYDFMPKYHFGKVERIGGEFLRVLEREFECRGTRYKVEIAPAVITDRDGVKRYHYPSKREELVEDALRRFATTEKGLFLDDRASVTFTLYQLQQELKQNGHSYSISQLKDALYICAKTTITVTTEDNKAVLISNMFETLGLQTREDWKEKGTKAKAFVRFNSLVTESIKNGAYRQLNYAKAMSYSSVVARQLHKRMSHHYTQASIMQPYHIMLSTIIRDFGLAEYERPSQNLHYVVKALEEMKGKAVLLSYTVQKTVDVENRRKILDAKFILTPHPFFASELTGANVRHGKIKKQLGPK